MFIEAVGVLRSVMPNSDLTSRQTTGNPLEHPPMTPHADKEKKVEYRVFHQPRPQRRAPLPGLVVADGHLREEACGHGERQQRGIRTENQQRHYPG
jgi:hypothetical protein